MRLTWLALPLALDACGQQPVRAPNAPENATPSCAVRVTEVSARPARLEIDASCTGPSITGFSAADEASLPYLELLAGSSPLTRTSEGFRLARPQRTARIRYAVDLERIASSAQRFDSALRVGDSLIAPASTFLLTPDPLALGVVMDLDVRLPPGERFASGLSPSPSGHTASLQAHEASVATYGILGHFQRETVNLGAATLEIIRADGKLDAAPETTLRWVADAAHAVRDFYGAPPAPHTFVLLIPVPDHAQVLFGKVLPQSAPGVAVLVGEHTTEHGLYDDWILVHELFHIGFPSFHDEAKWLDEGSATYFEPIIRARAGRLSELEVWSAFARDMPQGLAAFEHEGLEHPSQFRAVYWGGAIACLVADVTARQRSHGALGLEDGFRAVLRAGGDATHVWTLAQVREVIDRALGAPILADVIAQHADSGSPFDLTALFARLGVVQNADGSVILDDRAELAAIRRAITYGH